MKRRLYIAGLVTVLAIAVGSYGIQQERAARATPDRPAPTAKKPVEAEKPAPPQHSFNKNQFSLDDPASPWVIANKRRPLNPANYTPGSLVVPNVLLRSNITSQERQLTAVAAQALETLVSDARKEGVNLTLESGYRSYSFQVNLYNRYVQQQGQAVADTQSARAGHSEHQTGLAADLGGTTRPACNVEACFAETVEGKWLAANAHKYGFVIRYPDGKTPITGYVYEPWHLRYVGTELAAEMQRQGTVTMEEFFGLPAAPDYN